MEWKDEVNMMVESCIEVSNKDAKQVRVTIYTRYLNEVFMY